MKSVRGSSGSPVFVAVVDVYLAIVGEELTVNILEANDQLDAIIDNAAENLSEWDVPVLSEKNGYAFEFDHDCETIAYTSFASPHVGNRLDLYVLLDD